MKSFAVTTLILVLVAYLGLCVLLFFSQRSMMYFPVAALDGVAADDLRIESASATLQVWRLNAGNEDAIVYFGGNAENVAFNVADFGELFDNYTVYLVNYRGYGASSGKPTEAALYADALAVYDHIESQHASVSIIGRSLGSGVATYLATERPTERLALVTAFDSAVQIARSSFPFVPVSLLMRDRYDSAGRAQHISAPTLVIIAGRDEIIPRKSSEALAAAIDPALVTVRMIDDAGHNTIDQFPGYRRALVAFFSMREADAPGRSLSNVKK